MQQRPRVAVPAGHASSVDHGSTLHPDHRYSYALSEWWDTEGTLVDKLWNTRGFRAIGAAISAETGLDLHTTSHYIGNFLRFDRLSNWWIDSQTDPDSGERWVRGLTEPEPTASEGLPLLQWRFSDAFETISGGNRRTTHGRSPYSIQGGLLGRLVFSLRPEVWPPGLHSIRRLSLRMRLVAASVERNGIVTDAGGTHHFVSWSPWPGGSPRRPIDKKRPWTERTRMRLLRNAKLRETARIFQPGQRADAVDFLRTIVSRRTSEFLFVWDPYLDEVGVRDVLNWLHPNVECRALCGFLPGSKKQPPTAALTVVNLRAALSDLRTKAPVRAVECKYRIRAKTRRPIYHDRFLITRDAAWMLGTSLNSIGTKVGGVVELDPPATAFAGCSRTSGNNRCLQTCLKWFYRSVARTLPEALRG